MLFLSLSSFFHAFLHTSHKYFHFSPSTENVCYVRVNVLCAENLRAAWFVYLPSMLAINTLAIFFHIELFIVCRFSGPKSIECWSILGNMNICERTVWISWKCVNVAARERDVSINSMNFGFVQLLCEYIINRMASIDRLRLFHWITRERKTLFI